MRNGLGKQKLPEAVCLSASPHPHIPHLRRFAKRTARTLRNNTITTIAVAIDQAMTKNHRTRSGPCAMPVR